MVSLTEARVQGVREVLARRKAVIKGSHIVYTSGKHGSEYVSKDGVSPYTGDISWLVSLLAEQCQEEEPEFVLAPVIGGVALAQWGAHHLTQLMGSEVLAVYAEKEEDTTTAEHLGLLLKQADVIAEQATDGDLRQAIRGLQMHVAMIRASEKKEEAFAVKRVFPALIKGKRGVVIEDVLNSGGTVAKVLAAARPLDCTITSVCALVNRGGVTAEALGVPALHTLLDVQMDSWPEEDCPLCREGVPINIEVGHGKKFLARKAASAAT